MGTRRREAISLGAETGVPPVGWSRRAGERLFGQRRANDLTSLYVAAGRRASNYLLPRARHSSQALERLRNCRVGERCFIIGNGPSLKRTDLSLLRDEQTFGLNRISLLFRTLGFATTYLVSVNDYVLRQSGPEILATSSQKFLSWRYRQAVPDMSDVTFLRSRDDGFDFSTDVGRLGVWEGATVTYVALQLAYHMGFSEVILVGVDHSFTTQGTPHQLVVSSGPDPNHFDDRYFGTGYQWQLPDLDSSERSYARARQAYEDDGRRVLDATIGGRLRVFDKVRYAEVVRS